VSAHAADHRVFSLDVHDLKNVRRVSSVSFDERQRPHWLATDGSRIVVVKTQPAVRASPADAAGEPRERAARRIRSGDSPRHRVRLVTR